MEPLKKWLFSAPERVVVESFSSSECLGRIAAHARGFNS